ncbi:hypothetical protein M0L20_13665 [Spirosoma sp. RP8]|uniref:Phage major capsid protein n=1 Tax=Spirosoma liriopis TaxID=2937440 RepID=A0ABT0HLS8_9BACT|nr:hypothetical protein [Spirosoma liriopis]MCK8492910.1 hypothetical protein [Spirosoma liriopis]
MAGTSLNLDKLANKLKENVADYSTIFHLNLSNGFKIKQDRLFTGYKIRDKVPLIRSSSDPMVQPGRKGGDPNFKGGVSLANREGQLLPFQVNLKLSEQQIYAWSKTYLARKQAMDPSDIYSFPAMNWYMGEVNRQIGKDIQGAIYKGVYKADGTSHVDITDGLDILLDQGYATTGTGAVGDIPADNMITAAATINESNILSEIQKLTMRFFETMDEPLDETGVFIIDPVHYVYAVNALNAQVSNGSQIVYRDGNVLKLSALPNITLEPRSWLKGTSKHIITLDGNFAVLGPEEDAEDVPSIQVEKADRNIKIFIDGEFGINYADGRVIFMNNK